MAKKIVAQKQAANDKNKRTIEEAINDFLRYQIANARSTTTSKTYSNSLNVFTYWLKEKFGDTIPTVSFLAEPEFIDEYVR